MTTARFAPRNFSECPGLAPELTAEILVSTGEILGFTGDFLELTGAALELTGEILGDCAPLPDPAPGLRAGRYSGTGPRRDIAEGFYGAGASLPRTALRCENARMPILFILLAVILVLSLAGAYTKKEYRIHGVSLGTILLIVLLLWLFGVFGSRPF
jgi:hypothetical protein